MCVLLINPLLFRNNQIPVFRLKQAAPQAAIDDLTEKIAILEAILGEQDFFAGSQVTLADISLVVSIPVIESLFPTLLTPKLSAWAQRVEKALPVVKELHDELKKNPLIPAPEKK